MPKDLHIACHKTGKEFPEHIIGQKMAALARAEGQRPNHTISFAHGLPDPSPHRTELRKFFREHRGPITTSMISKHSGVPKDSVRDLCKIFSRQGWLQGTKSTKGYTWLVPNTASIPAE